MGLVKVATGVELVNVAAVAEENEAEVTTV